MAALTPPPSSGDDWVGLTADVLPVADALAWSTLPSCGAQVVFCGTVRDHADGRDDVVAVHYEAYDTQVTRRLEALAAELRARWPGTGRVALLHRSGELGVGEASVVVVVSAPHRAEAFDAARWAIDTLKATLPIWKREIWAGGAQEGWGTRSVPVEEVRPVETADQ